jgi:hypothetical protein
MAGVILVAVAADAVGSATAGAAVTVCEAPMDSGVV